MEIDPLAIILVKNGSKGDQMLFRYPDSDLSDSEGEKGEKESERNPYVMVPKQEQLLNEKNERKAKQDSNIKDGHLSGLSDKCLANLYGVKTELCGRRLEVKINDVRFIGFPVLTQSRGHGDILPRRHKQSSIICVSVVFALRASVNRSVVDCYHDLSKQLGLALKHEENCRGYVNNEAKQMLAVFDEVSSLPESDKVSPYKLMIKQSSLARCLKKVYHDLCTTGEVHLRVNGWIRISFCLPHKVHYLRNEGLNINPDLIDESLCKIFPYHGFILLDAEVPFIADNNPTLERLLQVHSPLKTIAKLAADADISQQHTFYLISQLVYWGRALIIYPICSTNVYCLTPNAPTKLSSELCQKFQSEFQNNTLMNAMSKFCQPQQLGHLLHPLAPPLEELVLKNEVVWLVQHRLLMQLHTHIYLLPGTRTSKIRSFSIDGNFYNDSENIVTFSSCTAMDGEILSSLSSFEREAVLASPGATDVESLKLFDRLSKYFRGHHVEDIMFHEDLRRSDVLHLIDKFKDVLITCDHEDDRLSPFYSHSPPGRRLT